MGCEATAAVHPQPTAHSLFGVLTVRLRALHLEAPSLRPNSLHLTMNNQTFTTPPPTPELPLPFQFTLNSRYQKHGRSLKVEAFQQGVVSESSVGVGITDLELIIRSKKREVLKVYLNSGVTLAGWVEIEGLFEEVPAFPVTLLFDSALIRRKTSKFTAVKCRVRATIGEEVLETSTCEDREDQPPSWKSEQLTFFALKERTKEGKVEILDGEVEIGHITINLQEVYGSAEAQIELNEQFHYQEDIVAGTIKFTISKAETMLLKDSQQTKSVFVSPTKRKLPPIKPLEHPNKQNPPQPNTQNVVLIKPKEKSLEQIERQKNQQEANRLKQQLQAKQEAKLREQEEQRLKEEKRRKLEEEQRHREEEAKRRKEEQQKEERLREQERLKQQLQARRLQQLEEQRQKQEQRKVKEEEEVKMKAQQQAKKMKEKQAEQLRKREIEKQEQQKKKKLMEEEIKRKQEEQRLAKAHEEEQKRKEEARKQQQARRVKQQQEHAAREQQEKIKEAAMRQRQAEEKHEREEAARQAEQKAKEEATSKEEAPLAHHSLSAEEAQHHT